ncbi:MAG TPA: hypothetical protein VGV37_06450 [Aliidongia sp.]|uniref:hypothetical protein n=1 Tax=Aliidongia sp. TaxID=1914230 RepID=UPI002DDCE15B|nr:hypothetical protein [Aliidongia sp.]HEV2674166.1 hypothetical protein [Aliidongia sp.]
MIDEAIRADAARRSVTDILLGSVAGVTSPWWANFHDFATSLLLYGSLFLLFVRVYGLAKDWWLGKKLDLGD